MARTERPGTRQAFGWPAAALALLAALSANAQAHPAAGIGSVTIEEPVGSLSLYTTDRVPSTHSIAERESDEALLSWPDVGNLSQVSYLSEPDPDLGRAVVVSSDMVSVSIHPISGQGGATISSTLLTKGSIAAARPAPHRRRTVLILAKFN